MTAKTLTCIAIACDLCGETFTDEESGGIPHFDTIPEARDFQDAWDAEFRWTICDDGYAVCPADDEKHDAARADLAPKPPTVQVPGQQEIPAEALPGFRGAGDCEPCQGTGLNIGLPGNCPVCGGTGNEPAADDAPSCRDCGTWPCARHATDADRAEHERATGSDEAETGGEPCRPCGGQGFWYTPGGEETVDCLLCGGTGVAGGAEQ